MKVKNLQETTAEECENDAKANESAKFHFDYDYRRFNSPPLGYVLPSRYCYCGRLRSMYGDKLTKFSLNSDDGVCKVNQLTKDALQLDSSVVYVTKKSLMLNQFLEFTDTKVAKAKDNRNRFHPPTDIPANNYQQFEDDKLAVVQGRENDNWRPVCPASSIFTDRRLVSLFRSVALYWFFCLNTVLAKSDVLKRKTLSFDYDNNAASCLNSNELNFKISPVVLNCFEDVDREFLWHVILDTLYDDEKLQRRSLLQFADPSRPNNMSLILIRKIFEDVIRCLCHLWPNLQNVTVMNEVARSSSASGEIVLWQSFILSYRNMIELEQSASATYPEFPRMIEPYRNTLINWVRSTVSFDRMRYENVHELSLHADDQLRFLTAFEDELIWTSGNVEEDCGDSEFDDDSDDGANSTVSYSSELNSSYSMTSGADLETFSDGELSELINDKESEAEFESNDEYEELEIENECCKTEWKVISGREQRAFANPLDSDEKLIRVYLPKGMLDDDPIPAPLYQIPARVYDMWRSPCILEDFLISRSSQAAGQTPAPVRPAEQTPLREASQRQQKDETPGISGQQRENETQENLHPQYRLFGPSVPQNRMTIANSSSAAEFSMFSVPYNPNSRESKVNVTVPKSKEFNMWASPTFTDCIPGLAKLQAASNVQMSATDINFNPSASSSSNQFPYYTPSRHAIAILNVKGDFKIYDEAEAELHFTEMFLTRFPSDVTSTYSENDASSIDTTSIDGDSEKEVAKVDEVKENEYKEAGVDEECNFKPIEPAFRVVTDPPAAILRSASGSIYVNNKKYMVFQHELDHIKPPKFQPKFEVRESERSSQTDDVFFWSDLDLLYDEEVSMYFQSTIESDFMQEEVVDPLADAAAYFSTLGSVVSYLNNSDIAGMVSGTDSTLPPYMNVDGSEYVDPTLVNRGYMDTATADFGRLY